MASPQSSLGPRDLRSHRLLKGTGENGLSRWEGRPTLSLGYLGFCVLPAIHLDSRDVRQVACAEGKLCG